MPTFQLTSPEGKTFRVTAPEGATPQQAYEYFQANQPKEAAVPSALPPQPSLMDSVGRTLGKTGKALAGGAASLADVGLLIPKTIANATELGLEATGMQGSALEQLASSLGRAPSMRDTVVGGIEKAFPSLAPQGAIDKTGDFLGEVISGAGTSSAVANAATKGGGLMQSLNKALNPESIVPTNPLAVAPKQSLLTSEDVRANASKAYQKATELGGILKPETTNRFLDDVASNIAPQTSAGKLLAGDSNFSKIAAKLEQLRDQPLTLDASQEIDEFLGDAIDGLTELGRPTKEGLKLMKVQDAFRKTIENATEKDLGGGGKAGFEALKAGRALWSKSMKLRDIERIIMRSEGADSPAQAIKSGFKTFVNNPNKTKGFTKEEIAMMRRASKTGLPTEILRSFGSRLNGIGVGIATGNPLMGAITQAGSYGAREAATSSQMRRANDVLKTISNGGQQATPSLLRRAPVASTGAGINILQQTKDRFGD